MKYTNNLNLKKPDQVDFYDVDDFNFNTDELDKKIGEILNAIIIASQNEAELGNDNAKMMSPLRVKQAILKLAPKPAMASQAEAEAGVDNTKVMTPLRTKQAVEKFAPLKTVNGQKPNVSGDVEILDLTPVGDVVYRPYLRAGYVKANGATVNRADYPRLVKFATDNNLWTDSPSTEPWKYGRGNGSTTMVLPDYRNRFIQGGDNAGTKNAGLPNIIGEISCKSGSAISTGNQDADNLSFSGALSNSTKGGSAHNGGVNYFNHSLHSIKLNANLSNPIYGNSKSVQPPSITLVPQIRY